MGSAAALPRLALAVTLGLALGGLPAADARADDATRQDHVADAALTAKRAGDPAKALALRERALKALEGKPGWPHAAYAAATEALDLGRDGDAKALLRQVAFGHPGAIDAPRALRRLAFLHPKAARASWYRDAARRLAGTPAPGRGAVPVRRGGHRGETVGPGARNATVPVIRHHATAPFADEALLHAADAWRALGKVKAAEALYGWVVLGPPGLPRGQGPFPTHLAADALMALGRLRAKDDPGGALHAWQRLLADHPTSRLCDDALRAIARLETRRGHDAAAKRAWSGSSGTTPSPATPRGEGRGRRTCDDRGPGTRRRARRPARPRRGHPRGPRRAR